MKVYDVVIIGGGVAGGATAIHLKKSGMSVAVVEQAKLGRNVLSTHFLWPRGVSYLHDLGLAPEAERNAPTFEEMVFDVESQRIRGRVCKAVVEERMRSIHGTYTQSVPYYSCIRRQYLDRFILERAMALGVDVITNTKVESMSERDGSVFSVCCRKIGGHGSFDLRGKVFIGADGRHSTMAKLMNVGAQIRPGAATVCCWSYYEGLGEQPLHLTRRDQRGYGSVSTSDGLTMVLVWGHANQAARYFGFHDESFINEVREMNPELCISTARRVEQFYRVANLDAFKRKMVHGNVILIGDACSFKDQSSASGITHALRDAKLVADTLIGGRDLVRMTIARDKDYDEYFEFACEHAAMNPLEGFPEISDDQPMSDAFFATISDSMKVNEFNTLMGKRGFQ